MSASERKPTGKAAALKYDPEKNGAPVLVASGMGYMAEKITEAAMRSGVPVYEDDSLATLLTQLRLGTEIPPELYQSIVEIYLYFLHFSPDDRKGTEEKAESAADGHSGEKEETNRENAAAEDENFGQSAETEPAKDAPEQQETEPEWSDGSPFIKL